jgi:hypothetical protein
VQSLKVSDLATIRLVAYLAEGLVRCQQLVEHITKIGLLFSNSIIDLTVTAGGIRSTRISWVPNSVVPILELKLALATC